MRRLEESYTTSPAVAHAGLWKRHSLTSARGAGADRRAPHVSETRWRSTVDRDHKDGPPPVHGLDGPDRPGPIGRLGMAERRGLASAHTRLVAAVAGTKATAAHGLGGHRRRRHGARKHGRRPAKGRKREEGRSAHRGRRRGAGKGGGARRRRFSGRRRNSGPAAFREQEPADGGRKDLGRMGERLGGGERAPSGMNRWSEVRTGGGCAPAQGEPCSGGIPAVKSGGRARLGVARSGAKRRLESAAAVEGGGARGDGASEAGRGNGADAGVRHDAAKPLVAVARNDGGGSGCGDRLEGRRRAAAGGEGRPDRAWERRSQGGNRRGSGVPTWGGGGSAGAGFCGMSGENGGGRGGDRAHVVGYELGCGRAPDFAATWAAMAVGVGRREVGGGADRWDRRSHLSAKGEKEGHKTDFCEWAKGEGSRPERGRRRAGRGRGRRGRNLGRARKGVRGRKEN
uniref:Uncharacterized protein n=1 Tax=Oryza sativa subsp. japonica TaxID=39947 RepID=Q60DZ2_ORYSJ|nr:hypothetical protein [Oryza sativa Japonica Group]